MEQQKYLWKRYWYPRESSIELLDGGYLYKPDTAWSDLVNPALVPLESLADIPCLILLGEPGIGKTSEMENLEVFTRNTVGATTFWFDLKGYQTELLLQEELFKSPPFQSWLIGTHELYLFLDGLDEGLLTISVLASLLARNLQKCPISRLHLRIACRTADWPDGLEEVLLRLWDKENVAVYQLAPLRREDVAEAVATHKLDVEHFLSEVDRKGVAPLASKPLTLRFLLNVYRESGTFPSTRQNLYTEGLLRLCEEQNQFRRDAGFRGQLSREQRLIVASRIAAVTIFTNHAGIQTGTGINDSQNNAAATHIILRELEGGRENIHECEMSIDEKTLKETLNTGLFIARGPERFGWVHRTYAEFLAAWYLAEHTMPLSQMMSLLVHPGGSEQRLVPQLHETAAWIATMRPDVFHQMMSIEPEVLLRSDVTTAEQRDRAALVETLLHLQDDARQVHLYRNLSSFYWKLDYPGLSSQLAPYIQNYAASHAVRMLAIDIATACKLQMLQNILLDITLDTSEPLLVQTEAAHAITSIGNEETKAKLKPFVLGISEDDPNDELKGCALQAVWPRHLTAEELFAALTPPKRQNYFGAYQRFLMSHFMSLLQPADLSIALQWVKERVSQSDGRYQYSVFFPITHDIMLLAWKYLDIPSVLGAFAQVIIASVEHGAIVEDQENPELLQVRADESKRRQVLAAALRECTQRQSDPRRLIDYKPCLILRPDIFWLIEQLSQTKTETLQKAVARLLGGMISVNTLRDDELMDAVCIASQRCPSLASELSWLLQPVTLGSPEAKRMKEAYEENLKREEKRRSFSLRANAPSLEHITSLLDECEQGNISKWYRICWELAYRPDGTLYQHELRRNEFPGWDTANDALRLRLIDTAKKYAQSDVSGLVNQIDERKVLDPLFVAYKTLQLLAQEMPACIFELSAERWKYFMLALLLWCLPGEVQADRLLIDKAHQVVPEQVIQTMLMLIDRQGKSGQEPRVIQTIESCWDDGIASALLEKMKDEKLGTGSLECLLRTLFQHQVSEAREFALSLVDHTLTGERTKEQALIAAKLLLRYAGDPGWSVVWSVMQRDKDFGMKLITKFAQSFSGWVPPQLTEEQLADIYIWLVRCYSPSHYPIHLNTSFAGTADSIALWRDALIGGLRDRGTFEACEAIRRIARELPELDQFMLKWILLEAQELARRNTWKPVQPQEILKIVSDTRLRLVQSGEQLLEVVIESLRRLEANFHDELPAWPDVWDRVFVEKASSDTEGKSRKKLMYRPKDENEFSNRIARHLREELRDRGIIINREVVIRKSERTDIHVDAVIRNSRREVYDSISVIIEVKGCWNDKLYTAMEEQLVDRYLKENHCHYGLYLIGWFNCDRWDGEDYREEKAPKMTLEEAQSQFDDQADILSQHGLIVKAQILDATVRE